MKPGDLVGERFVLEAVAGRGAMGVVFRARDVSAGQPVAVKFLTGGPVALLRFAREIEIIERLHHPRIVRYVAHGTMARGAPYLAMEWLEGETLQSRLERGRLTMVETIDIARAIAEALVAAHAIGIVHRDLKPANVFLVGGEVDKLKVVDFGIARVSSSGPVLTGTGDIVGTPAYMSPEQALSKKDLDGRSDLFSLGSILYRCISGAYPFEADGPLRVLLRLTSERAAPLAGAAPGTPPKLASLIDAMLAPDPSERPESAALVHDLLSRVRGELAPTAGVLARRSPAPTVPVVEVRRANVDAKSTTREGGRLGVMSGSALARPNVDANARAMKLDVVYLAVFGLGTAALFGLAGVWAFTLGPLASTRSSASMQIAPGKGGCPVNALGCTNSRVRDVSRVDPVDLATEAAAFGKTFDAGDVTLIKATGLRADGVDLSSDAKLAFLMTGGIRVEATGTQLAAFSDSRKSKGTRLPFGACGVKEAYRAAAAEGIATSGPWRMTLSDKGGESGADYLFAGPDPDGVSERVVAISARDCKRTTIILSQ